MRMLGSLRRIVPLCCVASLHIACDDDGLTKLLPRIEADPTAIDFSDGIVDRDNVFTLTVKNTGSGPLEIERIDVMGEVFTAGDPPATIRGLSEAPLSVTFVPRRAHEVYEGALVIHSDDPETPALSVPLNGVGGVREIEVIPTTVDFGTVNEGTQPRRTVEIRNVGGDPLVVSSVTWTSTSVDMGPISGSFESGTILPGTSTTVEFEYSPTDLFGDSGVLTIASNDEDEPEVDVPVTGNANLAPRAIAWGCDKVPLQVGCDGQERARALTAGFRRLVGLDGRESFDPEGEGVTSFTWRIVERPDGSNAIPFHSTDDRTMRDRATGDIEIDRVGRFDVRLIVRDARGVESLDRPESHVLITPKDLEVLLTWDIATDVDLHFVRPGGFVGDYGSGVAGTSTGTDCSTFNRQPNWNDAGTALDDPRLDKDDVTGRGPEIVSIDAPEDGGAYGVFAHYCDSQQVGVNVNVTVEVHVRGMSVATIPANGTYTLLPGEVWEGARITWDPVLERATIEDRSTEGPVLMPSLCVSD